MIPKQTTTSNFSSSQWKELTELQNDEELTIKEADKGSAVVLMDTPYYKNLIFTMLNNNQYYEKATNYSPQKVMKNLNSLVHSHSKDLTLKEIDFLTNFKYRPSLFYGLPKIHKSETINNTIKKSPDQHIHTPNPVDLKLRPIVAGPACETHRLSYFMDLLLKPLLKHIKSYVRDDLDMLNHLPKKVKEDTTMVSFDVINLYTSIPHSYGLEAIRFWLHRHPEEIPGRISKEFITESIEFILHNNHFRFEDQVYRQKCGIAMGTRAAPVIANLTMGYLEITLYQKSLSTFGYAISQYVIENWKRFLDDCFILWNENKEKLLEFKNILNNINPNLQFTMDSNQKELPFLDILIKKTNREIQTDIFYKTTDAKQYLLFESCHPRHVKTNIPFNLARRICTIVSEINIRDYRLEELKQILINRHYPIKLIEDGIRRASQIDIKTLRKVQYKNKNATKTLPYISIFNPRNKEAFNTITQNLPHLHKDPKLKEILNTHKIIRGHKQPKSLKRILTKAALPPKATETKVSKCGRSNCATCPNLLEGSTFLFKEGQNFRVKSNFTCASENLIYVITCMGCQQKYIGSTSLTLRRRCTLHRQQIASPEYRMIPLSGHIENCAQNFKPQFLIFPFFQLAHNTSRQFRLNKENFFIEKYTPKLNHYHHRP